MPVLALVVASILWGVATSATKFALGGFGPLTLLSIELFAATVFLWAVLLWRGYRAPCSWWIVAALGLLEPGLAYLGETIGLDHTSASNAALIFGLESTFVVVLAAIFLRERISRPLALSVLAALLGLAALEGITSLTAPRLGDTVVLAGALSAAGYSVVARKTQDDDPLALTAHQFAFASLVILPTTIVTWAEGGEAVPTHVDGRFWTAAVLVGVGGFAITFLLYNWAIAFVNAGASGVIINLIPAFALISAVLWLGDGLTAPRIAGGALILISVATFSWAEIKADSVGEVVEPLPEFSLQQLPTRVLR